MTRMYGVNEHFFYQESKTMWYVLGISFAKVMLSKNSNIISWQSASKPLLEIVNSSLESDYPIYSRKYKHIREGEDDFTMQRLSMGNPILYESMSDWGLSVPKKERIFPKDVEEQYLDHFIRGIFDAQVSCVNYIQKRDRSTLQTQALNIGSFGIHFIQDLYETLVQYANIKSGKSISKPPLIIRGSNVRKVKELLYRDWEFIEESGLYLPSKKERFEIKYDIENHPKEPNRNAAEKHNRAIDLLREGKLVGEVAEILRFSSLISFSSSFAKVVGRRPSKFIPKQ